MSVVLAFVGRLRGLNDGVSERWSVPVSLIEIRGECLKVGLTRQDNTAEDRYTLACVHLSWTCRVCMKCTVIIGFVVFIDSNISQITMVTTVVDCYSSVQQPQFFA